MGTVATLYEDWCAGDNDRERVYVSEKGVAARWISQAQERFADKSECIRSVWSPTIPVGGSIALPSDFGREIKDRVKWDANTILRQIDYPDAINGLYSSTRYYSIWGNTFYVWSAAAGTPTIPYIKKPTAITAATLSSADLEIPSDYHRELFNYFDSMLLRRKNDFVGSVQMIKMFDSAADNAKIDYSQKSDSVPRMRGRLF